MKQSDFRKTDERKWQITPPRSNLMKDGVFLLCDMPEMPQGITFQEELPKFTNIRWELQYGILSTVKAIWTNLYPDPHICFDNMPTLNQVTSSPNAWMEFLGKIVDHYSMENDRPITDHDAYLLVFSELMCGGMKDWLKFMDTGVFEKYPAFSNQAPVRPVRNREKTQGRFWSRPPQLAKLCLEFRMFKAKVVDLNESLEIEGLAEDAHPFVKEMTIVSTILKAVTTALNIEAANFLIKFSFIEDIAVSSYCIRFNNQLINNATLLEEWNQTLEIATGIFQGVQFRNGICAPKTMRLAVRSPLASFLGLAGAKRKVDEQT